ncbi:outer membrane beta-barrel protein [Rheinheimera tilapiae]|uniref:Outer membrane beta-barrel protein n=1 Tax=Rheinheimera tilapiae TaxID=875043 RepID=A0ABV6BD93_9GAMM
MGKLKLTRLTGMLLCGVVTTVQAQEPEGMIRTESGIDLIPGLVTSLRHDDNVIRDKEKSVSSWLSTIAPSLKANLVDGVNNYTLSGALRNGKYFSSSEDDYTDGYLDAEARLSPGSAHQLKFKGTGSWLHEDRGTGVSEGRGLVQDEVTRYNSQNGVVEYEYGNQGSTGKLRANARYYAKDYDNFRDVTQYRDHDLRQLGGGFVYQTGGAFKLVAEVASADINFKSVDLSGARDNQDTNYRLGTEWEMSAITTGILKLGYQKKDFDLEQRENFSGFAWETIVQWQPLTYSGFDLAAGRRAKDVDALNINSDYIVETSYSIGWNHQWSESLTSKLAYEYQTDAYNLLQTSANSLLRREDTNKVITAELTAKPKRWLQVTGFINLEDRTSTLGIIEFDRTVYGVEFKVTL